MMPKTLEQAKTLKQLRQLLTELEETAHGFLELDEDNWQADPFVIIESSLEFLKTMKDDEQGN